MHKFVIIIAAVLSLAACTTTQQGAVLGAGAGAVIGGTTTGTVGGAVTGAAIGGVSGAILGELLGRNANNPDECYYRDSRGRVFLDECPQG